MKKVMCAILVVVMSVVFASSALAATLVEDRRDESIELTSIVMLDITNKGSIKTTDVGGLKTVAAVESFLRDVVPGKNVRFVSSDAELLQSWADVASSMGFKPKAKANPDLSAKAQKILRRGNLCAFEIRTVKGQKFGLREAVGVAGVVGTIWSLLK